MITQQQWINIERLLKNGFSVSQISSHTGISLPTIYKLRNNKGPKTRSLRKDIVFKEVLKYKDYLDTKIRIGVKNGTKLFSELKCLGYKGSYASLNRYLKLVINKNSYKNYKLSIRFETEPGQQAQVDWTYIKKVNFNNKIEKLYCFVFILAYSRMKYFEFTLKQNLFTLIQCQIHAFEKLGIPKEIVYDNMKSVVSEIMKLPNGIQTKRLNPIIEDFAKYYDFEIITNAPYWPRAKGKVERAIGYLKGNFSPGLKIGRKLKSLEELNQQVQNWLDNTGNIKPNETTKEKPIDRWLREKPFLNYPNNLPPYQVVIPQSRYADKDGTISFKSCVYPIPQDYARKKIDVNLINQGGIFIVGFSYKGTLIAEYYLAYERYIRLKENEAIFFKSSLRKKIIRKVYQKMIKEHRKNIYPFIPRKPMSYYNKIFLGKD